MEADSPAEGDGIGGGDGETDWCARARETPRSDEGLSWRAFLRPAPPLPPDAGAGGERAAEPGGAPPAMDPRPPGARRSEQI